jgi:UDPglucose--hexose-1-phosphate uridylyltransferase
MTAELRWNPLAQRWVVIAGHRQQRPADTNPEGLVRRGWGRPIHDPACPFCPGNEDETLPAVRSIPEDGPEWSIRVVPNKYPSFDGDEALGRTGQTVDGRIPSSGASEVVIFTPRHDHDLPDLEPGVLARLIDELVERRVAHARFDSVRHTSIVVNRGPASGASITHGHAQVLSTPFVPPTVESEIAGFAEVDDLPRSAFGCDRGTMIAERPTAIAGCPRWAGNPYETWIVPTSRDGVPTACSEEVDDVAVLLADTLRRQHAVLGDVDYNVVLRLPPHRPRARFHWHVQVIPRHVAVAGFEISSGVAVNAVPPELAAGRLRDVGTTPLSAERSERNPDQP